MIMDNSINKNEIDIFESTQQPEQFTTLAEANFLLEQDNLSKEVMAVILRASLLRTRQDHVKKLHKLAQQNQYGAMLKLLGTADLVGHIKKLISTSNMTKLIANDVQIALDAYHDFADSADIANHVLETIIFDNFELFVDTVMSTKAFKEGTYTDNQFKFLNNFAQNYLKYHTNSQFDVEDKLATKINKFLQLLQLNTGKVTATN